MNASILLFVVIAVVAAFYAVLRVKHIHLWFPAYVRQSIAGKAKRHNGATHVLFCFVDHFEPRWGKDVSIGLERERVDRWVSGYPELVKGHLDADGFHPQHTFFYPEEEYRFEHLEKLASLCRDGYGEIEVHLHHDNDTSENLARSIRVFCETLNVQHGALSEHPKTGKLQYGFIHGNWVLDNSGADGRMCGVNDELQVLRDTGCYADFTFPSAPHPSQPRMINSIYYALDDPEMPKSHDSGRPVRVGGEVWGDLMLVNGPLMLNWKSRKLGIMPRIENADIRLGMEPTAERVDLWVDAHVHVQGRPEWLFVKVHTHGVQERDVDVLLGRPVDEMFSYLESKYNDGEKYCLHYVNSREMYNIIKAAEDGKSGNPNEFRDYILPRPTFVADENQS